MSNVIPASEYADIFLSSRPLIDVRAPVEFIKGAFPCSTNLPLMNDNERQQIGTCYKQSGQQAAIDLGHKLVSGTIKQQRIDSWCEHVSLQPESYLYCFRGGLRSKISQQWLQSAGVDIPFIHGGYKAMRSFLIDTIERAPTKHNIVIISGSTGSGKTEFINQRIESIDLEGLANHRGSSFGKQITQQPSQINFENSLAVALLNHQHKTQQNMPTLLLEDESFLIGRTAIPQTFYQAMQQAPLVLLEQTDEERIQRLYEEYVLKMHQQFCAHLNQQLGFDAFAQYLKQSINKIQKRLGGKQHDAIILQINNALTLQKETHSFEGHFAWITLLLKEYYDPMYRYQLTKKNNKIIFKGNHDTVNQWLNDQKL